MTNNIKPQKASGVYPWLVFLLSSLAIMAAARGDLWLDEIWSLSFARAAESASDLFTRFQSDNNHPLNTLYLYFLGEQKTLYWYRLLAVLSGIGSVWLAGYVGRKEGRPLAALCGMISFGASYPLLLYFSEARGYASAILFGLIAYAALNFKTSPLRIIPVLIFWIASVLGILSHATFIMLTLAFVVWHIASEFYSQRPLQTSFWRLMVLHGPPLAFFAFWSVFFLKNLTIGGGPVYSTWLVIGQASSLILGLPDTPFFRVTSIILVLVVVTFGTALLHKKNDPRWVFFPAIIVIMPALLLIVTHPEYLYFRYFIICFPFFLLLCARLFDQYWHLLPSSRRWLVLMLGLLWLAGQVPKDYSLIKMGRGRYTDALQDIVDQSADRPIAIGSDHDFRNHVLFDFYAPRVKGGEKLLYMNQSQWATRPPDWILTHSQDVSYNPPQSIVFKKAKQKTYSLNKEYRFSGISGWNWFVFKLTR